MSCEEMRPSLSGLIPSIKQAFPPTAAYQVSTIFDRGLTSYFSDSCQNQPLRMGILTSAGYQMARYPFLYIFALPGSKSVMLNLRGGLMSPACTLCGA